MPTTHYNFRFSLLFWAKPVNKCLPIITILLLLNSGSGFGQSGTDFTRVFSLSHASTRILDLAVQPDGSCRLTTLSDPASNTIDVFHISEDGEIINQHYLTYGDPIDFRIIPYGSGYMTYGLLSQCDVTEPPSISTFDSTGNQILKLLYDDWGIASFDSVFVLPLADNDFWVFRSDTFPYRFNAGGFLTGYGPANEPVYQHSMPLTDNQYLAWGNPGLALYNTGLTQKKYALTSHHVLEVSLLANGNIAALSNDSLWILDNSLSITKGIKLPLPYCVGLETDGNFCYLMYAEAPQAQLLQINENLEIVQTIPVTSVAELKPEKFVCQNGDVYYAGSNSRSVAGMRKTALLQPVQDTMPTDAALTEIIAPSPVLTHYAGFQGFKSEWSNVSVVITNNGADVINEVTVNSLFNQFYFICLQSFTFSQKFSNLEIQPGESDTLALPELSWYSLMPPSSSTYHACFWTKLPNDSLDSDVTNDQFCDQFPIVVSTTEDPIAQNLSVSPNPSSGTAMISLPEMMQSKLIIGLFNHLGQEVQRFNYEGLGNIPIHKGFLPAGMYVVKITDAAGQTATGKIIFD